MVRITKIQEYFCQVFKKLGAASGTPAVDQLDAVLTIHRRLSRTIHNEGVYIAKRRMQERTG